jgi:hypothetical protein
MVHPRAAVRPSGSRDRRSAPKWIVIEDSATPRPVSWRKCIHSGQKLSVTLTSRYRTDFHWVFPWVLSPYAVQFRFRSLTTLGFIPPSIYSIRDFYGALDLHFHGFCTHLRLRSVSLGARFDKVHVGCLHRKSWDSDQAMAQD